MSHLIWWIMFATASRKEINYKPGQTKRKVLSIKVPQRLYKACQCAPSSSLEALHYFPSRYTLCAILMTFACTRKNPSHLNPRSGSRKCSHLDCSSLQGTKMVTWSSCSTETVLTEKVIIVARTIPLSIASKALFGEARPLLGASACNRTEFYSAAPIFSVYFGFSGSFGLRPCILYSESGQPVQYH